MLRKFADCAPYSLIAFLVVLLFGSFMGHDLTPMYLVVAFAIIVITGLVLESLLPTRRENK